MPAVEVELRIGADEYLKRYRVPGAQVLVQSSDGRRVQFPATILQRFVTHAGVTGRFVIRFDDGGKLVGVDRVADI